MIGTYLHGPVLARNPALANHLLSLATGLPLAPLEMPDQEPMPHHLAGVGGRALMRTLRRIRAE